MRDIQILLDTLTNQCPTIHKKRLDSLLLATESALEGADLTLSKLGRSLNTMTTAKHAIKRVDRLLGNTQLHRDKDDIYKWHAHLITRANPFPVVLIDWSDVREQLRYMTLRASVALDGRAVTLYEQAFEYSQYNSPKTHQRFLDKLQDILPLGATPIIVSDAGFRNTWFRQVQDKGWFWIGRVRGEVSIKLDKQNWQCNKDLYPNATSKPKALGECHLARRSPLNCRAYLVKLTSKGRKAQRHTRTSQKHTASRLFAKNANDPWLLVTNIPTKLLNAIQITKLIRFSMLLVGSVFPDMPIHSAVHFSPILTQTGMIMNPRSKMYLFLAFCIFMVNSALANTDIDNPKGAACLISDEHGRVVVTLDILNGSFAIPGGYIGSDTPEQAAIREAVEETGIEVAIRGELARPKGAVIFDCEALTPIPVYEHSNRDSRQSDVATVAAWQAEHFGREVRAVYLMQPNQYMSDNARFPEQVEMFKVWQNKASISAIAPYTDFSEMASPALVEHARINATFQNSVSSLPTTLSIAVSQLLRVSSFLGDGVLVVVLVPFAFAIGGLSRALQVCFSAIVMASLTHFMKLQFAVPRPFYILPELKLAGASGFAFPSGHTATAALIWGFVGYWLWKAGKGKLKPWLIALIPVVLVAASRVYLGVHYFVDVLAGFAVGILSLWFVIKLSNEDQPRPLVTRSRSWLVLFCMLLPLALTQVQPVFAYFALFALMTTVSLLVLGRFNQRVSVKQALGIRGATISIASVVVLGLPAYWFGQHSNSSIEILAVNGLVMLLLSILWVLVTPLMASK